MNETLKTDLKNEALELAEDVTVEAIQHVFSFAKKALEKSDNPLLVAIIPVILKVEDYLLSLADKIDGVQNAVD